MAALMRLLDRRRDTASGALALAQDGKPEQKPDGPTASAPQPTSDPRTEIIGQRQGELRSLEEGMRLSESQRAKIESELELIRTDRVRLTAAMLETTARVQS